MRHGQTDYNRRHVRCGGDVDIPLDAVGRKQAGDVGCLLKAAQQPVAWIVASMLQRTDETARIVGECLGGVPLSHDPRLNERQLGEWNGLPIDQTEARLRAGDMPPGGESNAVFRARVQSWLGDFLPLLVEPGLVVASKGVGRILGELLLGAAGPAMGNGSLLLFEGTPSGNRVRPLFAADVA